MPEVSYSCGRLSLRIRGARQREERPCRKSLRTSAEQQRESADRTAVVQLALELAADGQICIASTVLKGHALASRRRRRIEHLAEP